MSDIARINPTTGFISRTPEDMTASMLLHMSLGSAPAIETLEYDGTLEIQLANIPAEEIVLIQGYRDGDFIEFTIGSPTTPEDIYLNADTSKLVWTSGQDPDLNTTYKVWYRHTVTASTLRASKIGAILRTLIEAISKEFDNAYSLLKQVFESGLVDYARGLSLDWLCALTLGTQETYQDGTPTPRLQPTISYGYATFYGNTGDTIGTDVIIQTSGTSPRTYEMVDKSSDHTIPSGTDHVTIQFKSTQTGSRMNASAGEINLIASGSVSTGVTVLNLTPFAGGSDLETDADLADRAKRAIIASGKATIDSIRYNVIAIAGIEDCFVNDASTSEDIELGRIVVNVVGETIPIDESSDLWAGTLDEGIPGSFDGVIETVKNSKAAGIAYSITQPYLVYIDIIGRLKVSGKQSFDVVRQDAEDVIDSYFNSLGVGDDIKYSDIIKSVRALNNVDDFIIDKFYRSDASNLGMGDYDGRFLRDNAFTSHGWRNLKETDEGFRFSRGTVQPTVYTKTGTTWSAYTLGGTGSITLGSGNVEEILIGVAGGTSGGICNININLSSSTVTGNLSASDVLWYDGDWTNYPDSDKFVDDTDDGDTLNQDGNIIFHHGDVSGETTFSDTGVTSGYYIKIDVSGLSGAVTFDDMDIESGAVGQVFEAETNKIYGVFIDKALIDGSLSGLGNMTLNLKATTGTPALPTGSALASVVFDAETLATSSGGERQFQHFWFDTPVELVIGDKYVITLEVDSDDWDNYQSVACTYDENINADGHLVYYDGSAWKAIESMDVTHFGVLMHPTQKFAQSFYLGTKIVSDEQRVVDTSTSILAEDETKTPVKTYSLGGVFGVYAAMDLDGDGTYESKSVSDPVNYGHQSGADIAETSGDVTLDDTEDPDLGVSEATVVTYEHYDITHIAGVELQIRAFLKRIAVTEGSLGYEDSVFVRIETDDTGEPSGNILCGNELLYCIKLEGSTYNEVTGFVNSSASGEDFDFDGSATTQSDGMLSYCMYPL